MSCIRRSVWFNTGMFLVRVVPLVKLPASAPSIFDYFWPETVSVGALVKAPLGRRTVLAIVLEVHDVRSVKMAVKGAGFELRRLAGIHRDNPQLSAAQMELARWMSVQYACSLSTAVRTVAPSFIGAARSQTDHPSHTTTTPRHVATGNVIVSQPDTARAAIADAVRTAPGQVLVLVPDRTIADALVSSVPSDTVIVHSGMSASRMRAAYRGVLDGSIRVCVGTRTALFLPWSALTQVIVEDPLNEAYKSDMAPRYNAADVARHLASIHGAAITWLTPALSVVQYHLQETGNLSVEHRKPFWPSVTLTTVQGETEAGHHSIFSREATDAILDAYERHTPLLVVSSRRAYATVARCIRCATSMQCDTCGIPLRWHRTSEDMLVCYHCGAYRTIPRQCPACRAGTLKPTGIPGSQKLAEAVSTILDRAGYPRPRIPILDSDLVQDSADVQRVFESVDAMERPILVATAMVMGHRYTRTFGTVVVPHLDMLASNPDYRTQERLIMQLEKLSDFAPSRMVLQTYGDETLSPLIPSRGWPSFFAAELVHRKMLRWPPYARIVKLSFSHRDRATASRSASAGADRLRRALSHTRTQGIQLLGPAPALVERGGGRWTHHLILKSSVTPTRLAEFLQYVPDGWTVDVDPRTVA